MNDRKIKLKKSFLTLMIATCLILATTFVTNISAEGNIIYVDDDADPGWYDATHVKTITEGITNVIAGGTIIVYDGTYTENVVVDKSLTLVGDVTDPSLVTVKSTENVAAFTVTANDVEISGFTMIGPDSAEEISLAGVYLDGVSGCTISDNVVTDSCSHGFWLVGSDSNDFTDNVVSDNNQGFSIEESDFNTFTDNIADRSGKYGFYIQSSSSNEFIGNEANENTKHGFYLTIDDGTTTGSDSNTFTNNIANLNVRYGLRIVGGTSNTLTSNTFDNNILGGLQLEGKTEVDFTVPLLALTLNNNAITNNPTGIQIEATTSTVGGSDITSWTIAYNDIVGNDDFGIKNLGIDTLDATLNYWGHISGPYHSTTNTGGLGDDVSDNVDYSLWLGVTYGTSPMTYCTNDDIQEAIDAATAGDTIIVSDGTYDENVDVNKLITLVGNVLTPASVLVTASDNTVSVFKVTANNVNISGFKATGADRWDPIVAGIYLDGVSGCTISDNVLVDNYDGIYLGIGSDSNTFERNDVSGNGQGFEIVQSDGNTFTENIANDNWKYGFKVESGSNNTFTDNIANSNDETPPSGSPHGRGFYLSVGSSNLGNHDNTFTGNTANENLEYGFELHGGTSNTLTGNTFDANKIIGILLLDEPGRESYIHELTLSENTITDNPTGIMAGVYDGGIFVTGIEDVTSWAINYNDIVGNTLLGIENLGPDTLDATCNWWGHASGPYNETTNPIGHGDNVSDNVSYNPWLLEVGGVIYDLTIPLVSGWNLISTPKILNNSFIDLSTIIPSNLQLAYRYNPTTGWASTNTMPGPLEAIFVRMSDYGGIGFKWTDDQQSVPPARYLPPNWSLIGPNMEGAEWFDGLTVDVLLTNINATTQGYQVVYSPWCNFVSWTVTYLNSGSQSMLPFEGYWVFMNSGMMLAGRNI